MTTIVYDGTYLAVDSQTTEGSLISYVNKLWKYEKGYFAVTGVLYDYPAYKKLLEGSKSVVSKKSLCIFTENNKIYEYVNKAGTQYEVTHPYSWGSGSGIAMGAIASGSDAIEAIKLAKKYDAFTGGRVRYIKVKD